MGISGLNNYFRNNCSKGINEISIEALSGKKIVVDASIYMYKFKSEYNLIDGFYQMLIMFKYYNIDLIFVFDGKPPAEKKELIKDRRELRKTAKIEYNELIKKLLFCNKKERQLIEMKIRKLKRQIVKIYKDEIIEVKQLLNIMGVSYYESEGESDIICAKLVIENMAYACLSEDMDMFVYGCPRVLRYFSLHKKTTIFYNLCDILDSLNISFNHFQIICILAGTDYNKSHDKNNSFYKLNAIFKNYKNNYFRYDFINWLFINNHIDNKDEMYKTQDIFNTYNVEICDNKFYNSDENPEKLNILLKNNGFIMVE